MNEFEKLKQLENKIDRLSRCLEDFKKYPYVVLSDSNFADDFYSQTEKTKRKKPIPAIRDIPPEMAKVVRGMIEEELLQAKKEFSKAMS